MKLNIIHLPHRIDRLQLLRQELSEQNISNFRIWDGITDVEAPHIGISKAHKQIVRDAQDNNLSEVLIGEDDLHFTAAGSFRFFLDNKPADYDIYLASIYYGTIKEDNTVDDFSALTFYMVNRRFYSIFLAMPENQHLDRALRRTGKFVVCNPFTVIQHDGYSDNMKQHFERGQYLKNRSLLGRS